MLFSNKYIRKKGMFMKRKIKSVKGFTLAELLIVVAIIAVLVAIGIPIFTSQLEKSREAVDLSDVRSAYAEVMMAAITGDTTAIYTKDASQMIYKNAEKEYSITVKPLKQKQDGWQTALPITIGGVSSTDNVHWVNKPGANGQCRIVYTPAQDVTGDYVTFYWDGSDSGNSGTDGNTGTGEDNGNNGENGSTGEDNNSGGTTDSGNDESFNHPNSGDVIKDLNSIRQNYPDRPEEGKIATITIGNIYYYDKKLYIGKTNKELNYYYYGTPDKKDYEYLAVSPTGRIVTSKDVLDDGKETMGVSLAEGDIYRTDRGKLYIRVGAADVGKAQAPTTDKDTSRWVMINIENS